MRHRRPLRAPEKCPSQPGEPLYLFGYVLSYTTSKSSNLKPGTTRLTKSGHINMDVNVTDSGPRTGDEVVQPYVKHLESNVERAREELEASNASPSSSTKPKRSISPSKPDNSPTQRATGKVHRRVQPHQSGIDSWAKVEGIAKQQTKARSAPYAPRCETGRCATEGSI